MLIVIAHASQRQRREPLIPVVLCNYPGPRCRSPRRPIQVVASVVVPQYFHCSRWITRFERNDWFVHKDYKPSRRPDLID